MDWSKAFDSVTFTTFEAAMEHVGVPEHTRQVVMALYANHTFVVRVSSQSLKFARRRKASAKAVLFRPIFLALS